MADNLNNKRISALSLVGKDRYDQYVQELSAQGTIAGNQLSPSERKEAFKKRNNKVAFKTFVEKVLQKKAVATARIKPIGIKALPAAGGALVKYTPQAETQKSSFGVLKILKSILDTLKNQFKFDKKKDADDKKEEENERRSKRESALEGVKKIGGKIVDKVIAPFKSIFDRIWNFIFFTLLGRAFTQLMNWLGDPKNSEKVAVLGRFLKDWWPALLGLYFMPFKGFMLKTLGSIAGFAAKFALVNPLGLSASVALGGEYLRRKADPIKQKITKEYAEKEAKRTGKTPEQIKEELKKIDERSQFLRSLGNVNVNPYEYASGGFISSKTGIRISGAGADTQLTALQPGEVVMNVPTVKAVGANNLLALNSKYGGPNANKPKFANNIQFADLGGMVGLTWRPGTSLEFKASGQAGDNLNQYKADLILGHGTIGGGYNPLLLNQGLDALEGANLPLTKETTINTSNPTRKGFFGSGSFNMSSFQNFLPTINQNTPRKKPPPTEETGPRNGDTSVPPVTPTDGRRDGIIPVTPTDGRRDGTIPVMPMMPNGTRSERFQGGGMVKGTTGIKISGATADRRLTAVQPGEYILPTDTVSKLGSSLIDKLVATTDSNSNPTKFGKRNLRYMPTPLSRGGKGGVMTLPPITQSTSNNVPMATAGTPVSPFSATSSMSDRGTIADIYGIV